MESLDPCEFLPWDTNFFGYRIARVIGHRLSPQRLDDILTWCKLHTIDCLYFLADSNPPETPGLAEKHGFSLVDIRVTLQCDLENRQDLQDDPSAQSEMLSVRPSQPNDISFLQAIARAAYTDSRFHSDQHFPLGSSQALYEIWIKRSCEGYADIVLVAERNSKPIGYVSCHLPGKTHPGQIGLVGIAAEARGCGVGKTLINHSLHWFAEQYVASVNVVTQGRNIAAQRLYQRCGFLTQSVQLWYHKWLFAPNAPYAATGLLNSNWQHAIPILTLETASNG